VAGWLPVLRLAGGGLWTAPPPPSLLDGFPCPHAGAFSFLQMSQLLFAILSPNNPVPNLMAANIAASGAVVDACPQAHVLALHVALMHWLPRAVAPQ
jgi:hypothetical protein